jgi:hypothetical protein
MGMSRISAVFTSDVSQLRSGFNRASTESRKLGDSFKKLGSDVTVLKRLLLVDLFAGVTRSAISAGRAVGNVFSSAANDIDAAAKASRQLGLTNTDFTALKLAANQAGIEVDTLSKAMLVGQKRFLEAESGSKSAIDAFAALGLSIEKLAPLSSVQRFAAVSEALGRLEDPMTRSARAAVLLGEESLQMADFFADSSGAMREAEAAVRELGLGLTELETSNVEDMNNAFARAQAVVSGVIQKIVAGLSPAVSGLLDLWEQWIGKIGGANALGDSLVESILSGLEVLAPAIDAMADTVYQAFLDSKTLVSGAVRGLLTVVQEADKVAARMGIVRDAAVGAFWGAPALADAKAQVELQEKLLRELKERNGTEEQLARQQARLNAERKNLIRLQEQAADREANNAENLLKLWEDLDNGFGDGVERVGGTLTKIVKDLREGLEGGAAVEVKVDKAKLDPLGQLLGEGALKALRGGMDLIGDLQDKAFDVVRGLFGDNTKEDLLEAIKAASKSVGIEAGSQQANSLIASLYNGSRPNLIEKKQLEALEKLVEIGRADDKGGLAVAQI